MKQRVVKNGIKKHDSSHGCSQMNGNSKLSLKRLMSHHGQFSKNYMTCSSVVW